MPGCRPQEQAGAGTVVDLRVDRSDDPLGELARLLDAADAFAGYNLAVEQLFGGDPSAALGTIDRARRRRRTAVADRGPAELGGRCAELCAIA
ncbi:MAG TPA: hypothetical protein VKU77_06240 [Streptosporangiaceae bacterium]|nr:hypothetical protein [Streptosporangiaceae bacterium]